MYMPPERDRHGCEAAFTVGVARFGRNEFSFQEIGAEPVFVSSFDLGGAR